jgi:hypothetical protein
MAPIQNMHRVNKKGAKILTVEPATQTIHASLGAGQVVPVNMYTYTPVVRWPKVGETWWLREENGSWFLDSVQEQQAETFPDYAPDGAYAEGAVVKFEGKHFSLGEIID